MKLEYIILILLASGFYYTNIKEYRKEREKNRYIENNLKESNKIITKSGIIGYVTNIDKNVITIITGEGAKTSYITIEKSYIEDILD
ncbi:preprotein translocase subunit YajC [Anaerococcus sp. NML200574]|uniref:Preprotein translocase subunit YajC n=1 Tax=Anaerococcus kampingae TaxID=3115614 RepID=A0ABW9MDL2_9FIRM|nr:MULTISPECIES: preprotein translocase subunit YajC [unclassified Anaerococcus]MCW6678023.1 preprotein translocase subunit YajC [Anaerococcus sp. NML200574]MCW6700603.1 preprotein translocase subunit YajC [Anaerococcus sp. NML200537]